MDSTGAQRGGSPRRGCGGSARNAATSSISAAAGRGGPQPRGEVLGVLQVQPQARHFVTAPECGAQVEADVGHPQAGRPRGDAARSESRTASAAGPRRGPSPRRPRRHRQRARRVHTAPAAYTTTDVTADCASGVPAAVLRVLAPTLFPLVPGALIESGTGRDPSVP